MAVQDTSVRHYLSDMTGMPSAGSTAGSLISCIDTLIAGFGSVTLASLTVASNVATGVVSAGHHFIMRGNTGPVITIAGATPSGLNGTWRVASVTNSTTFTFNTASISDGSATGTITAAIAGLPMVKDRSGTNTATYKFTDVTANQAYLHIDDTTTGYATAVMYSTMTGNDTGTNGTGAGLYLFKGTTTNVFADNKALYLFTYNSVPYWGGHFFGDGVPCNSADAYFTALMGNVGTNMIAQASYAFTLYNTASGSYLLGDYNQTASNIAALRLTHSLNFATPGTIVYPNPGSLELLTTPIDVFNSAKTNYRGALPGVYGTPHPAASFTQGQVISASKDMFMQVLSYPGTINYGFMAIDLTGPWR